MPARRHSGRIASKPWVHAATRFVGYRALLGLILLIVAVMSLVGIATVHYVKAAYTAAVGETLASAASEVAQKLDGITYERYGDIQLLARMLGAKALTFPQVMEYLTWMKESYPIYLWLGVTDANGTVIASTKPTSIGRRWSHARWFTMARQTRQIIVDDVEPFEDLDGGMDTVAFTAPTLDEDGRFQGAVTARVSIQVLEEIVMRTVRLVQNRHSFLQQVDYQVLSADGVAFIDSDLHHKGFANLLKLGLPSAGLVRDHGSGYVEETHLRRGDDVITGYAGTRGVGVFRGMEWTVLVRSTRSATLASVHAVIGKLGLAGGAVIVPLLAALIWMQRRLHAEWVEARTEKSRAVAAERALKRVCGELEHRVDARTAELAHANHLLADEVAERCRAEQRLKEVNESLEKRVVARTQDLLAYQEQLRSLSSQLRRTECRIRQRLATGLHDDVAQTLAFCKMKLEALLEGTARQSREAVLHDVVIHLNEALAHTRELMHDLRPTMLGDTEDLPTAVQWVINKVQRYGLHVDLDDDGRSKPLDDERLTVLYQSLHEALFNVMKHARTTSAHVTLRRRRHSCRLLIRDHGCGFTPNHPRLPGKDGQFGLFNMKEQADLVGGRLRVVSVPGKGTAVLLTVPLSSAMLAESDRSVDGQQGQAANPRAPHTSRAVSST